MSVSVELRSLLDYSDYERSRWQEWLADDPARLLLPFQPGGRFPTVWALLDHLCLVERRHLARLEGGTPPDATGVPEGDLPALEEYATLVRADFRKYVEDLDDVRAGETFSFVVKGGPFSPIDRTFSMTRRKLVVHVLLHEIRHLAQIAHAARTAGHSPPGDHDYFFAPER